MIFFPLLFSLFVVKINPLLLSGLVRWGYLSVMTLRMINYNGREEQCWIILSPWPSGQRWGIQSDKISGSHRDMSSVCSWKKPKDYIQCLWDLILILHFNRWMYRLIMESFGLFSVSVHAVIMSLRWDVRNVLQLSLSTHILANIVHLVSNSETRVLWRCCSCNLRREMCYWMGYYCLRIWLMVQKMDTATSIIIFNPNESAKQSSSGGEYLSKTNPSLNKALGRFKMKGYGWDIKSDDAYLNIRRRCSWSPITSYLTEKTSWPRALSIV